MALSENDLIIPALQEMYFSKNREIQTSELINRISKLFVLDNQDLTLLENRNDEKYTQIVRNLKSHKTLRDLKYAIEIPGGFKLTDLGVDWLESNGLV